MTKEQVKAIIATKKKGEVSTITYGKVLKTRKGIDALITKETIMDGILGENYDDLDVVKKQREDGIRPEKNAGLPKGTSWAEYPYFIKGDKTGSLSLRITKTNKPSDVKYYINGSPADREVVVPMCLAVEFPKYKDGTAPAVINVGVEKIKSIK